MRNQMLLPLVLLGVLALLAWGLVLVPGTPMGAEGPGRGDFLLLGHDMRR